MEKYRQNQLSNRSTDRLVPVIYRHENKCFALVSLAWISIFLLYLYYIKMHYPNYILTELEECNVYFGYFKMILTNGRIPPTSRFVEFKLGKTTINSI